jgi:serine/threonine protein kinase
MASWLLGKGLDALSSLRSSFTPQLLQFEAAQVMTTALIAEGGYSFVYSAKSMSGSQQYAVKKVLAQDSETRAIAETEAKLLVQFSGTPNFVVCHGTMSRPASTGSGTEYWFLLEYCPNGSLVDLIYEKVSTGSGAEPSYERRPPLAQERLLEVFEGVCAAIAHMHSLSPPMQHRDLKLENVLGREDGQTFALCDFGSATSRVLPADCPRKAMLEEEEQIAKYSTQM